MRELLLCAVHLFEGEAFALLGDEVPVEALLVVWGEDGALALVWPVADLSWRDVLAILVLSAIGHVLVNHLGYWLGVRPSRW